MLFFATRAADLDPQGLVGHLEGRLEAASPAVNARLEPAMAGLRHIAGGGLFHSTGSAGTGRRFTGWATSGHWMAPRVPG
jgi:hypothetical protein